MVNVTILGASYNSYDVCVFHMMYVFFIWCMCFSYDVCVFHHLLWRTFMWVCERWVWRTWVRESYHSYDLWEYVTLYFRLLCMTRMIYLKMWVLGEREFVSRTVHRIYVRVWALRRVVCEYASVGYGTREFVSVIIHMIYGSMWLCMFISCALYMIRSICESICVLCRVRVV